jgi:hypothetical protein
MGHEGGFKNTVAIRQRNFEQGLECVLEIIETERVLLFTGQTGCAAPPAPVCLMFSNRDCRAFSQISFSSIARLAYEGKEQVVREKQKRVTITRL